MMQSAHPFGYFALSFLVLALWLAGCHLPQTATPPVPAQDWLGTSVAATMTAIVTAQAPQDIPTQAILFTPTPFPTMTKAVTKPPLFTSTPVKTNTPERGLGSISGAIVGYPFGGTPRFTIVAYEQNPPYHYWYWVTAPGATSYLMNGYVSAGRYQVVAYSSDGPRGGCTVIIEVKANQTAVCDITDWSGAYRDKPAGVP